MRGHRMFKNTVLTSLALACLTSLSITPAHAQVRVDGRTLEQSSEITAGPQPVKAIEATPFREQLRQITDTLSEYAEKRDPSFKLIGRNPLGLMVTSDWEQQRNAIIDPDSLNRNPLPDDAPGGPLRRMTKDFDAIALDNHNCPKPPRPKDAPPPTKEEVNKAAFDKRLMNTIRNSGTTILSLDACGKKYSSYKIAQMGRKNRATSIAVIGTPDIPRKLPKGRLPYENSDNIDTIAKARNGLWLRNARAYPTKADWIVAMGQNNADIMVIDAFYTADQPLTKKDVHALKYKFMGARRLLLAGMDLGTARDDRFYWKREWRMGEPSFLRQPAPDVINGILVNYWDPEWKRLMGEYFKGLMDLGFDGIMLQGLRSAEIPESEALLE